MTRLLLIALCVFAAHCNADIASDPWPKKIRNFPSEGNKVILDGFKITVTRSQNQEAGGSGGGIYDILIQNLRTGKKQELSEQSVGVAILELHDGWPQLEIWSRAGGGSWCRSLHRFTGKEYCYLRTDEFTEFEFNANDKTRKTIMPGDDTTLFFVETRIPEQ